MDEKNLNILPHILENEVKNLKEEVNELKTDAKEDRKIFTAAIQTMSENLIKLTTIQEQQMKQMEDVNVSIDDLRKEWITSNETNVKWYQGMFGKVFIAIIVVACVGWGIKGIGELVKLIGM